jgi:hypothetical protein
MDHEFWAHPHGYSTGVYNRCLDQANVQPQGANETSCPATGKSCSGPQLTVPMLLDGRQIHSRPSR